MIKVSLLTFAIVYLGYRLFREISENSQSLATYGIPQKKITLLYCSIALYFASYFIAVYLSYNQSLVYFVPVASVLLLPGIFIGHTIYDTLERSGTDQTKKAEKVASNIKWVGIFGIVGITAHYLIFLLTASTFN